MFSFFFLPVNIVTNHNHGIFFYKKEPFEYFDYSQCDSVINRVRGVVLRFYVKCVYIIERFVIIGEVNKICMINNTMFCRERIIPFTVQLYVIWALRI